MTIQKKLGHNVEHGHHCIGNNHGAHFEGLMRTEQKTGSKHHHHSVKHHLCVEKAEEPRPNRLHRRKHKHFHVGDGHHHLRQKHLPTHSHHNQTTRAAPKEGSDPKNSKVPETSLTPTSTEQGAGTTTPSQPLNGDKSGNLQEIPTVPANGNPTTNAPTQTMPVTQNSGTDDDSGQTNYYNTLLTTGKASVPNQDGSKTEITKVAPLITSDDNKTGVVLVSYGKDNKKFAIVDKNLTLIPVTLAQIQQLKTLPKAQLSQLAKSKNLVESDTSAPQPTTIAPPVNGNAVEPNTITDPTNDTAPTVAPSGTTPASVDPQQK